MCLLFACADCCVVSGGDCVCLMFELPISSLIVLCYFVSFVCAYY